jgi:hypothetical protein
MIGRLPSVKNAIMAMPPRSAKIGIPSSPAIRMAMIHGSSGPPSKIWNCCAATEPATTPPAAIARPTQVGEARQARRRAISVNATGNASVEIQTGTPAAMIVPAMRSLSTSARPPTANIIAMAAPTKAPTTCATAVTVPLGRNSPVASVRSLPSRAAIAAPRRPTHSVRFNANGPAPGMPVSSRLRIAISASGITMMPASASAASTFSAPWSAVTTRVNYFFVFRNASRSRRAAS